MSHVFISYVRENTEQVQNLQSALEAAGVEVWIDRDQIKPGTRWQAAISEAIASGAFFIACFSREYNLRSKSHMNEEITLAIDELRKRPTDLAWFIPLKLSECEIPARSIGAGETLHSIQWVELYDDWNRGIESLLSVINPTASSQVKLLANKEALLFEILENSLPKPRASEENLKNQGFSTAYVITLFHLEPSPRPPGIVSQLLLPKYGWHSNQLTRPEKEDVLSFRQSINAVIRTEHGFGLSVDYKNRKVVMSFDASRVHEKHADWKDSVRQRVGLGELNPQPYWEFDDLFDKAGTKLYGHLLSLAKMMKENIGLFQQYHSSLILQALLIKAIELGMVFIDFDARTGHNHGTKFRLRKDKIFALYDVVISLGAR